MTDHSLPALLRLALGPVAALTLLAGQPAFAGTAAPLAEKAAADAPVIKLTLLGTGAPRPSDRRSGPATLVEAGPFRFLIDAGSGTREQMFRAGGWELITGIDKIFLTHLHYDHMVDVPDISATGWMYGRREPLTVYGPRGTEEMIGDFNAAFKWDRDMRELVGIPMEGSRMAAHDVGPGVVFDQDGLKITAFPVQHMPIDVATGEEMKFADGSNFYGMTLGYRIDYKGHSVLFSGDTRSTEKSAILTYGQGIDVLIHEVQVPSKGNAQEAKLANMSLSVHSTPEQAGKIFAGTKPGLAVYNHIIPPDTDGKELAEETRPFYKGPLVTGEDFMTISIGKEITIGEQPHGGTHVFEQSRVVHDDDQ
ncbi:MAG: MBL fold metallo-hydrolase [Candidatus Andeanibacterium colombiense]|uniref:MBL fold metallo-hydrolase n=1 Tax=Candidatus Andeanibacterium colombiense TaxID=3121345 RepID=A0AAJ5X808_9SPHN|nr:MAG: MBL fold metallo-hydrolase [Sphingomonadaceae bacterium]